MKMEKCISHQASVCPALAGLICLLSSYRAHPKGMSSRTLPFTRAAAEPKSTQRRFSMVHRASWQLCLRFSSRFSGFMSLFSTPLQHHTAPLSTLHPDLSKPAFLLFTVTHTALLKTSRFERTMGEHSLA